MEVKYNLTGAVTSSTATVTSKLDFVPLIGGESELKVMRVEYSANLFRVFINNELLSTDTSKSGNFAFVFNMMFGSDADDVAFFNGYIPEFLTYKNTSTMDATTATNVERWLANKWLTTGSDFNGYTVQTSEGAFPTVSSTKWLHFDETSLNITSGQVTTITDKAAFGGVAKTGTPTSAAHRPSVELAKFKGKSVAKYEGNQNFKVPGLSQAGDPDFFTMFIVYRFEDIYSTEDDQTMVGAITNGGSPTYNTAIRIKKYEANPTLNVRISASGFAELDIPADDVFTIGEIPNVLLGTQQLVYTTDPAFLTGLISTAVFNTYSNDNGVIKFNISSLSANTKYYCKIKVDGVLKNDLISFTTFPTVGTPTSFKFVAGSCNYTGSNTETWDEIRAENPLFWSHLGDWHYEDISSPNKQLFRDAFDTVASQDKMVSLNRNVPLAYVWDDHDYGANNSDKDNPAKAVVTAFYQENIPHYPLNGDPLTNTICQAWTVGRVRFIMTDMRSQRTSFLEDDYSLSKTMLGSIQKAWFKNELITAKNNEDIALICWLNPSSWTGEDLNGYSWDYGASGEHWTAYKVERTELYNYIYDNDIRNIFIINGDTHQQAIDDGRNAIFNNVNGGTLNWETINSNLLTPIIESSPFDKDIDRGSGQFQYNNIGDSGTVPVLSEKTYTIFDVTDNGSNWIKVDIKQYALPDGISYYTEKTLVNHYSFIRDCNGIPSTKPELDNILAKTLLGSFVIPDTELIEARKIQFTSPTSFNNNWKAPIIGNITLTPYTNKEVRIYRRADIDYLVGTSLVNPSTGQFTFTGNRGIVQLVFKIYDTLTNTLLYEYVNDGNYGTIYTDLEAQLYYTTDIDYLQKTKTVSSSNNYSFIFNDTGQKTRIKLVRKSTNEILAESTIRGVLPRSYDIPKTDPNYITPFASKGYLYDAGLAIIAATGLENYNLASEIVNGVIESQFINGSVPFGANHINPVNSDAYLRSGAIAWVAYGLGYYIQYSPSSQTKTNAIISLNSILTYLISMRDPSRDNLIKGGSGRYISDIFEPSYQIPWISTEHNIDSYFAFKQAGLVLSNSTYTTTSAEIGAALINSLYDSINHRMYQGLDIIGEPDTADALDINSWGAIAMISLGRSDIANYLLQRLETYYACTDINSGAKGYKPYSQELGYPSAVDTVWFEGSFGVALAYHKYGNSNKHNSIITELFKFVESDGSFRYATLRDQIYEISDYKSVASTSWAVIANNLKDSVWI